MNRPIANKRALRDAAAPGLPRRYVWLGAALILAVAIYVLWLWYLPDSGGGVDEAAYLLGAKGIARQMDPVYLNPDPQQFVPEMMIETKPGVFYPVYPIGYPLLAAIGYKLGGPEGAFVVNPVLTVAALAGVFFLAKLLLDDLFALAAMMIMAFHPTVLYYGTAAWSHAADLAFSTWCLFFAPWWYRKPAAYKLAVAGFLAGYAVSIRYTEALLALPLGYLLALRWMETRSEPAARRRILAHAGAAAAAGIVAMLPLLWFQAHAFGGWWRTGYSFTGQASAFGVQFFTRNFFFALWTLCSALTGLFVFFPIGIAALFFKRRAPRKMAGFLALASVPTVLLYGAYYWANRVEPVMYVRFFLTIFPVVVIAALLPVDVLTRQKAIVRYGIAAGLVLMASTILRLAPDQDRIAGTAYSDLAATRLVQKNLPANAVIMGNGYMNYSLIYYTDMTVIYPVYFSEEWVHDRLTSAQGGNGATTDFNPLRMERFKEALGGRTQHELYQMLEAKLVAYAKAGRTVALIAAKKDPQWFSFLSASFNPKVIAIDDDDDLVLVQLNLR